MFFQPPALPHRVRRGWGLVGRDSRLNLSLVPRSRYVVPPTQHFWEYSQAQPRLGKAPSSSLHNAWEEGHPARGKGAESEGSLPKKAT